MDSLRLALKAVLRQYTLTFEAFLVAMQIVSRVRLRSNAQRVNERRSLNVVGYTALGTIFVR